MVFRFGKDDLISLSQVLAAPSVGDEVNGFSRAASEDQPGSIWCYEKRATFSRDSS